MSNRHVIPTAQRAALLRLERADGPVMLHMSVSTALKHRGLIEAAGPVHWQLTDRGRALIDAMNDPRFTMAQVYRMYV